jgi:hypothetical protein
LKKEAFCGNVKYIRKGILKAGAAIRGLLLFSGEQSKSLKLTV